MDIPYYGPQRIEIGYDEGAKQYFYYDNFRMRRPLPPNFGLEYADKDKKHFYKDRDGKRIEVPGDRIKSVRGVPYGYGGGYPWRNGSVTIAPYSY